jgi:hypothetical protein
MSARERKESEGGIDSARETVAAEDFTSAAVAQDDDARAVRLAGKEKGFGAESSCERRRRRARTRRNRGLVQRWRRASGDHNGQR